MSTDIETAVSAPDVADDSDTAIVMRGGRDLQRFLATSPDGVEIFELLARRLDRPLTVETWRILFSGLETILGVDATTLLAWVATADEDRFPGVEPHVPSAVVPFLRRVVAAYGVELQRAYELSSQRPDNWRVIHREVYHDIVNDAPYLRIRIEKFSGEETVLEGNANAILGIARNMVLALQLVGARDAYSAELLQAFAVEVSTLMKIVFPNGESAGDTSTAAGDDESVRETPATSTAE